MSLVRRPALRSSLRPALASLALSALLLAVPALLALAALPGAEASAGTRTRTWHYLSHLEGSHKPKRLGFDLFDIHGSPWAVRQLPRGVKGLVYVGEKCPTPADAAFRRTVRKLAKYRKVFGYFLSDEPHIGDCPGGPAALASRADYVRRVTHGRQRSFIVLDDSYHAFRPHRTHVDLVGLDPYPCSVGSGGCKYHKIVEKYRAARHAGIPRSAIVPVYQAFGQENVSSTYYTLPTPAQERRILQVWAKHVPHPVMDYAHGWGNQGHSDPTLVDSPPLQRVFADWFARH